jgi:hypothetical protein
MTPRVLTVVSTSLLALAIAVRLLLVVLVPTTAPSVAHRLESLNDEPAHVNYIRYLAAHRVFPVQTHHAREPGAVERGDFEYWQPPFYHLMCVPIYTAAGDRAGLYACRTLSFVFGLLSLVVLSRILALLGCTDSCRRLGVVFLALLPTHSYFTSLVSNDSLTWLISLLLTRELLVLLTGAGGKLRIGPWGHARVGLLLATGMLTKSGIVIFYPVFLAVYAYVAMRTGRRGVLAGGLVALAVSAAIAAPWYARNLATYGSLFAAEVAFGPHDPAQSTWAGIWHTIGGTIRFFWFPSSHITPLPIVRALRSVGGVIVALHVAAALMYVRRQGLDARGWTLAGLLALALAAHFRLNWIWGEAEARFLFPALAAIVFFFVQPAWTFLGRFRSGEAMTWAWVSLAAIHPWILLLFASPVPLS